MKWRRKTVLPLVIVEMAFLVFLSTATPTQFISAPFGTDAWGTFRIHDLRCRGDARKPGYFIRGWPLQIGLLGMRFFVFAPVHISSLPTASKAAYSTPITKLSRAGAATPSPSETSHNAFMLVTEKQASQHGRPDLVLAKEE